jgi:pyridoxal 5'-phosphate synthase pdxT subunit
MTPEPAAERARPRVGVLALQGAVREHVNALRDVGAETVEVRLPRDLVGLDALILPGGESTTMRLLMDRVGLTEPIRAMAAGGAPMLGTCAGMILLSTRIADGDPTVLGLLDMEVRRNAYGRQLDSFEADVEVPALGEAPIHGVFIRAPVVTEVGPRVEVMARDAEGRPIAVRQGRIIATAFHPELTDDRRLHRLLVSLIGAGASRVA